MRVYCHIHKKTFQAESLGPIVCEQGHLLGAAIDDKSGLDLWEYCCGCQTFWLVSPDGPGATQCPNCREQITTRFLCEHCRSLVLEPATAVQERNFFLSLRGAALPSCPGCTEVNDARVVEHECRLYGASFATPRTQCPFCDERISSAPSFPIAVADYLDDCKEERIEVEFDPSSNRFVKATNGSFLVFPGYQARREIQTLFPNVSNFDSQDQFSMLYGKHFICDEPAPGPVIVDYPATVTKAGDAWIFNESGRLSVIDKETNVRNDAAQDETSLCATCGTPAKSSHRFCKKCGAQLALATNVTLTA